MKSLLQTIYNFIFSPRVESFYEIENINNKKPIQDSGIVEKFTGDNDENTSNIKYIKIFQPFYSDNSIIIKNKDIEEDSFFDNLTINFNSKDNFSKLSGKNSKPVKRDLIKEFDEVANHQNNPKALISLEYNKIKTSRIEKIVKNCLYKYQ